MKAERRGSVGLLTSVSTGRFLSGLLRQEMRGSCYLFRTSFANTAFILSATLNPVAAYSYSRKMKSSQALGITSVQLRAGSWRENPQATPSKAFRIFTFLVRSLT
jgi:hypothetical protein